MKIDVTFSIQIHRNFRETLKLQGNYRTTKNEIGKNSGEQDRQLKNEWTRRKTIKFIFH